MIFKTKEGGYLNLTGAYAIEVHTKQERVTARFVGTAMVQQFNCSTTVCQQILTALDEAAKGGKKSQKALEKAKAVKEAAEKDKDDQNNQ